MLIAGLRLDTSASGDPSANKGPRWRPVLRSTKGFKARHPEVELRIREVRFTDPFSPLRNGSADVVTSWLPVREPDLTVGPVVVADPLLLMVAEDHPLASRDRVGMEDLGDWPLPQSAEPVPEYWLQTLVPTRTPSGRPIRRGPKVASFQEVAAVVAAVSSGFAEPWCSGIAAPVPAPVAFASASPFLGTSAASPAGLRTPVGALPTADVQSPISLSPRARARARVRVQFPYPRSPPTESSPRRRALVRRALHLALFQGPATALLLLLLLLVVVVAA